MPSGNSPRQAVPERSNGCLVFQVCYPLHHRPVFESIQTLRAIVVMDLIRVCQLHVKESWFLCMLMVDIRDSIKVEHGGCQDPACESASVLFGTCSVCASNASHHADVVSRSNKNMLRKFLIQKSKSKKQKRKKRARSESNRDLSTGSSDSETAQPHSLIGQWPLS